MTPSQIIVLATPVFFLLIAIEIAWGYAKRRNTYRLNDAINSISLGMLSQISAVFTRLLRVGIYTAIYSSVALYPDAEFWNHWSGWLLALVFYDLCYYWLHRAGHECAVFWAAHVVHHLLKPLAMLIAIVFVAIYAYSTRAKGYFSICLLAALMLSLAGDVFLMLSGYFIPGLVSFLVAHLFYIALFKQGMAWFPSRRALLLTLSVGLAMYAFLWSGLSPVLRVAVAAYVLVIALMAAQAIGRATLLKDKASLMVAIAAGFFMLSDALLASNRFVQPLPLAPLWVLSTYYIAQLLIAQNAQAVMTDTSRDSAPLEPVARKGVMESGSSPG